MTRVDEEAEAVGRRAHVTDEARDLGDGLAELAALAGILDEEARPVGHLRDELAELARRELKRRVRARMALGVADVKADPFYADLGGDLEIGQEARDRRIADAPLRAREVDEERAVSHPPEASTARALDQRGAVGRVGHPVVAEAARISEDGLEGVHALFRERGGDGRERGIDGQADTHGGHCTACPHGPRRVISARPTAPRRAEWILGSRPSSWIRGFLTGENDAHQEACQLLSSARMPADRPTRRQRC
jgi:hypothetical protein